MSGRLAASRAPKLRPPPADGCPAAGNTAQAQMRARRRLDRHTSLCVDQTHRIWATSPPAPPAAKGSGWGRGEGGLAARLSAKDSAHSHMAQTRGKAPHPARKSAPTSPARGEVPIYGIGMCKYDRCESSAEARRRQLFSCSPIWYWAYSSRPRRLTSSSWVSRKSMCSSSSFISFSNRSRLT
jgi:hypothetical protein